MKGCLVTIAPYISHLHLVSAPNGRGVDVEELFTLSLECGISKEKITRHASLEDGLLMGISEGAKHHDIVIICGTFFIMKDAREFLGISEPQDPLDLN